MHNPSTGQELCVQWEIQGVQRKQPRVGRGTRWTGSSPAEYSQSCSRGGGEAWEASTGLNYSIILDQEKHLCPKAAGTSGAILYSLQLVYLISCTADTYRNPTPPTLARFPPPLLHFFAKRGPKKKQHQGAVKVQVKLRPSGKSKSPPQPPLQEANNEHPLRATRGLSNLPGAALCPPANRAARRRGAPDQLVRSALSSSFYVKSPSSLNCWPVCYCQGSSTDPAQSPSSPGGSRVPTASSSYGCSSGKAEPSAPWMLLRGG